MRYQADRDNIARRRRRLSIDYQLKTRSALECHGGLSLTTKGISSRCFSAVQRQFLPHYFASPPPWRMRLRRLIKDRVLPDFCIIGPAKSGTSDLAVTIMAHPNVLCPLVKEFPSTDPLTWRPFYPTRIAVQRHAEQYGVALCPLVAPHLHLLDIPITLSSIRPDAKIIINLRNPVDLVFSMWKWNVLYTGRHFVERVPFLATFSAFVEQAIELFPQLPLPFGPVLHCGIYATSVSRWLQYFDEQNVRIFDIDWYFNDRNAYFQHLQQYLGLPQIPLPPHLPVANRNPLEALAPAPDAAARLRDFFEPYNRRLWGIIGTEYSW